MTNAIKNQLICVKNHDTPKFMNKANIVVTIFFFVIYVHMYPHTHYTHETIYGTCR